MEADPEVLDQLALIGQRLRRIHDALGLALHRGDEAFLGGNVGVEENALKAGVAATLELPLGDHADGEVGTVRGVIAQLLDAEAVEVGAAVVQILVVRFPRGNGIVVHAAGGEDGFPQLFDGLRGAQLREELLGPRRAGNGRDAPLIFVFHLIAVRLDDGVKLLLGLHQFFLIDALEAVGILGDQIDPAGKRVHIVLPARLVVAGERGKCGQAPIADVQLLERLIVPIHDDLLGLQLVAFLNDHLDEFRLVKLGVNKDLLPLLNVRTDLGDQLRIFSENCFFHQKSLRFYQITANIIAHLSVFEKQPRKNSQLWAVAPFRRMWYGNVMEFGRLCPKKKMKRNGCL